MMKENGKRIMSRKLLHSVNWFLALALLCLTGAGGINAARADAPPQMQIMAAAETAFVGGDISFHVKGIQLRDLYAYEVNLQFDPAILQFQGAVSGTGGFTVPPVTGRDRVQLAHTHVGAGPGLDGEATLFTVTFRSIAAGTAVVSLAGATLVDSRLQSSEIAEGSQDSVAVEGSGSDGVASMPVTDPTPVIKEDGHGKKIVEMPPTAEEIRIPANRAGLDGPGSLEVRRAGVSLELPPEVLQQLKGDLTAEQLINSAIYVAMNPLPPQAAEDLLVRAQASAGASLKLSGEIVQFGLGLITGDNQTAELTSLAKPLTLRFKVNSALNPKLVSIYRLGDDGSLEFIGGTYHNGEITAEVHHFGKYAALEYDKDFRDMPEGHWAKPVIAELAARHIIAGTGDQLFEPDRTVSRAELAAMLVRTLPVTFKGGGLPFADVTEADWYFDEIAIAVQTGIVEGVSAASFEPDRWVTREEMAIMLMRAYRLHHPEPAAAGTGSEPFADRGEISPWALSSIDLAHELQLIQGRGQGVFVPQGLGTRAEAAVLAYRLLEQSKPFVEVTPDS